MRAKVKATIGVIGLLVMCLGASALDSPNLAPVVTVTLAGAITAVVCLHDIGC